MDLDNCKVTSIDNYSIIQSGFAALKIFCASHIYSCTIDQATIDLSIISTVLSFPKRHVVGIIQCGVFSDGLISLSNMDIRGLNIFIA